MAGVLVGCAARPEAVCAGPESLFVIERPVEMAWPWALDALKAHAVDVTVEGEHRATGRAGPGGPPILLTLRADDQRFTLGGRDVVQRQVLVAVGCRPGDAAGPATAATAERVTGSLLARMRADRP